MKIRVLLILAKVALVNLTPVAFADEVGPPWSFDRENHLGHAGSRVAPPRGKDYDAYDNQDGIGFYKRTLDQRPALPAYSANWAISLSVSSGVLWLATVARSPSGRSSVAISFNSSKRF